ncbi:MAG: hypothetical protein OXH31_09510 [Gammaproteobacteria bacterium]|nr:hypothetical protein [Gammaproteobacteria bacterium]
MTRKRVSDQQIQEYLSRMQQVVRRTSAIDHFLDFSAVGLPHIVVIEVIFLQLRHILELIATALLVLNPDALTEMRNQRRRKWHALDILKTIETINPTFYPKPTKKASKGADGVIPFVELKGGFLSLERFTTLYRRCGQILHTEDPFSTKPRVHLKTRQDFKRIIGQVRKYQSQIIRLLTHHVFVTKDEETMYVAQSVGPDHEFYVAEFVRSSSPN